MKNAGSRSVVRILVSYHDLTVGHVPRMGGKKSLREKKGLRGKKGLRQ